MINFNHSPIHEAARVTVEKLETYNRVISNLGDYKRAKVCAAMTRAIQSHLNHLQDNPTINNEWEYCTNVKKNVSHMMIAMSQFKVNTDELQVLFGLWGQAVDYAKRRKSIKDNPNDVEAIKTLFDEEV